MSAEKLAELTKQADALANKIYEAALHLERAASTDKEVEYADYASAASAFVFLSAAGSRAALACLAYERHEVERLQKAS
jgi:hypothetical protein